MRARIPILSLYIIWIGADLVIDMNTRQPIPTDPPRRLAPQRPGIDADAFKRTENVSV